MPGTRTLDVVVLLFALLKPGAECVRPDTNTVFGQLDAGQIATFNQAPDGVIAYVECLSNFVQIERQSSHGGGCALTLSGRVIRSIWIIIRSG